MKYYYYCSFLLAFFFAAIPVVTGAETDIDVSITSTSEGGVETVTKVEATAEGEVYTSDENLEKSLEETRAELLERRRRIFNTASDTSEGNILGDEAREYADEVRGIAQDPDLETDEKRQLIREENQEFRTTVQSETTDRQEEWRNQLSDLAKARVKAFIVRTIRRYNAAVERLELIAERIETRIEGLPEEDSAEAKVKFEEALGYIRQAEGAIQNATQILNRLLESETPRLIFSEAHAEFKQATENLRLARQALIDTIQLLKIAVGRDTAETNTDVEAEVEPTIEMSE